MSESPSNSPVDIFANVEIIGATSPDEDREDYFVVVKKDDNTTFHLAYKTETGLFSAFNSKEREPLLMLRDRCRMHKESLSYKKNGIGALCHPLLSPLVLASYKKNGIEALCHPLLSLLVLANSKTWKGLSNVPDADYALSIYELCHIKLANSLKNTENNTVFSSLWGTLERAVKTATESNQINTQDLHGNTPLHLAVAKQDATVVKFLLVMGADPNVVNNEGVTPLHVAAQMKSLFPLLAKNYDNQEISKDILLSLVYAGAKVCGDNAVGCSVDCMSAATKRMLRPDSSNQVAMELESPAKDNEYDHNSGPIQLVKNMIHGLARTRAEKNVISGLSLDGGGIKGLVVLQILIEIEERIDGQLTDYFDWIVGTSTGAIVAAALGKGLTLREIQKMYFQFKDTVFNKVLLRIPYLHAKYNAGTLERFMKKELGKKTLLSDIKYPMMFFPTVHAPTDRLALQRTYFKVHGALKEYNDPSKNLLWKALRRTTAAPTYFRKSENVFVDGGVAANNPAGVLLVELNKWNNSVPENRKVTPGCIVSIGCGRFREDDHGHPIELFQTVNLLARHATATDGYVVESVKAYYAAQNIPFFRLSPPLSQNVVLDTKDNNQLLSCMWDAFVYTKIHKDELDQIAALLKLIGKNEKRREKLNQIPTLNLQ